jgi:hypothetical protein
MAARAGMRGKPLRNPFTFLTLCLPDPSRPPALSPPGEVEVVARAMRHFDADGVVQVRMC